MAELMRPFGEFLSARLQALELGHRDFAASIGLSQAQVSKTIAGNPKAPPPPPARLHEWARVLKLTKAETEEMLQLALDDLTERSREEVQELVKSQRLELTSLRQEVTDLRAEIANLAAEVSRLRSKNPKVRSDA